MDEFGFRGSSSDSLSVSYTPVIPSAASRRTATSRSNVSLYLSQPSRLPSPRGSNPASKSSGMHAKESSSSSPVFSSGNTGLARFRSLRSMLPFGPKQPNNNSTVAAPLPRKPTNSSVTSTPTQTLDLRHRRSSSSIPAPAAMANTSKQGFLSVGRRTSLSLQKEKSLPAIPSLPRSHSEDLGSHSSPVMGISRRSTSPTKVHVSNRGLPLPDDPFKKPSPSDVTTNFFQRGPSREDFGTIRSRDLSTIIESELSHLSILKHSPPLTPSQGDDKRAQGDNESDNQLLAQLNEQEVRNNNLSIMHGQDTDVNAATADLSTSWEAGVAELRQSLHLRVPDDRRSGDGRVSPSTYSVSPVSAPSPAQELTPPNSLPTTSKSEVQLNSPDPEQDGGLILDLSRVDTDFAALLNLSKRPTHVDDEIVAAVNSMEPPPPMSSSSSVSPSPEAEESDRRSIVDPDDEAVSGSTSRRTSVQSCRQSVGMQSSPVRRSRPSSLALSIDSLPLADCATKIYADRTPVNNKAQQSRLSPTPRPDPVSPRTSHEELTETVCRPRAVGRAFQSKAATSEEPVKRRARVARLYETASRPSTAGSVSMGRACSEGGRPFLTDSQAREDRVASVYSPTARSRPTTSLGMTSRARNALNGDHPERPATALSSIGRGAPPIPQRSRKRSLSACVDARPQGRTVPDWMGPRTARAFAAAGLLDTDTDQAKERNAPPVPPRAESRMRLTGSRPSLDRESVGTCSTPSLYAPSRAGFSERSIPPSAGRRRASSRTMTIAEITSARGESPVTSITSSSHARTIFSSSTATSLSCSSPHQQYQVAHLESELSSLREKHSTEMEAILSALADSQRTSKALREENAQLQGRIRDLEEQLADMAEQWDEARRQPPLPPPSMQSSLTRSLLRQHRSNPHESPRGSPPRNRAVVRSSVDSLASDFDTGETHTTIREHEGLLTPNFLPSSLLQSRENRPRTRASTASSIFPVLPSNMSMLLHDEGSDTNSIPSGGFGLLHSNTYASSAGSPVASPTLNVNRMATTSSIPVEKTNERNRHATTLSLSSIEMSMLSSLPGSPKSLKLKPEHEKHLCDLKSLDFSVIDSD